MFNTLLDSAEQKLISLVYADNDDISSINKLNRLCEGVNQCLLTTKSVASWDISPSTIASTLDPLKSALSLFSEPSLESDHKACEIYAPLSSEPNQLIKEIIAHIKDTHIKPKQALEKAQATQANPNDAPHENEQVKILKSLQFIYTLAHIIDSYLESSSKYLASQMTLDEEEKATQQKNHLTEKELNICHLIADISEQREELRLILNDKPKTLSGEFLTVESRTLKDNLEMIASHMTVAQASPKLANSPVEMAATQPVQPHHEEQKLVEKSVTAAIHQNIEQLKHFREYHKTSELGLAELTRYVELVSTLTHGFLTAQWSNEEQVISTCPTTAEEFGTTFIISRHSENQIIGVHNTSTPQTISSLFKSAESLVKTAHSINTTMSEREDPYAEGLVTESEKHLRCEKDKLIDKTADQLIDIYNGMSVAPSIK